MVAEMATSNLDPRTTLADAGGERSGVDASSRRSIS
jgi:hypothetical protein